MAVVRLVATLSSYGRRAVVVGGVADRYASELARAGQSNRRRAGTGIASPERATRPPLWPAGMAEGNRETFGPRVGLSSSNSRPLECDSLWFAHFDSEIMIRHLPRAEMMAKSGLPDPERAPIRQSGTGLGS